MDVSYSEHWDQAELEIESMKLHETALNGGVDIAGYDEGKIVAFAAIEPCEKLVHLEPFDIQLEYVV